MSDYKGIPFNGGLDSPTGAGAAEIVSTLQAIIDFLILCDSRGVLKDLASTSSIDWLNRFLYNSAGNVSIDYNHATLIPPGTSSPSVDWQNRALDDATPTQSVDWQNRVLTRSTDGAAVVTWQTTLQFFNLPTSDPGVPGTVWNNGGTLMISL